MSIYLLLFFTFLKIGAVSFGGGYAMISLMREECLANGWLAEDELLNFIAVAESTPGPIAVNMATFVGSSQAGVWGALLATLGVVLPSFIIILLVSAVIRNLLKFAGVKAALAGVRPAVVGLILATAVTLLLKVIFSVETPKSTLSFDGKGLILFAFLAIFSIGYKKYAKKPISPIVLILISGALGVLLYGFL
jgi:chromate transporter